MLHIELYHGVAKDLHIIYDAKDTDKKHWQLHTVLVYDLIPKQKYL